MHSDTLSGQSQHNFNIKRSHSLTAENILKYMKTNENFDSKINIKDYFLHQRPFSNIKIILQQNTIWCDKALLSAASPIFRDEFLKNSKDDSLTFNDIDLNDFLSMLEFIYPIFNPEINENNISSLIELSYRFQFDMLKRACQIYVMKYLSTIKGVINTSSNTIESDEICFDIKAHNRIEYRKTTNLVEFHNQTCIDAFNITIHLCRWLKTYYSYNNIVSIEAIISILKQISIDYLEQAMIIVDINDEVKGYIYKYRIQYLERIHSIKPRD